MARSSTAANIQPTPTAPIVIATDGSDESVVAARWTTRFAALVAAPVEVLDVLHQPHAEMNPDDVDRFEREASDALARRLSDSGVAVDDARAIVGDVVDVLADATRRASMVVLGSAERAGWGRHGHFSLVHSLAHHVECPIVVIPSGSDIDRKPVVLVGIDGTEASHRTLDWARDLARRAGMTVVAAFVVDALYTTFDSRGWYGSEERRAIAESIDESVELVERFGADPAITLEAIAAEYDASLLVVGAKGRESLGGLLLGAIPDELLHHPTCPIVVVPHSMTAEVLASTGAG